MGKDIEKERLAKEEKLKFFAKAIGRQTVYGHEEGWEWHWYPELDSLDLPREMPTECKIAARKEIADLKKILTKVKREHKKTNQDPHVIYERMMEEIKERNKPMTYIDQMRMLEQTFKKLSCP